MRNGGERSILSIGFFMAELSLELFENLDMIICTFYFDDAFT